MSLMSIFYTKYDINVHPMIMIDESFGEVCFRKEFHHAQVVGHW